MNERPTPETDEVAWLSNLLQYETVDANFARRLERERDEAREQLAAERALADQLANFARNCLETSSSTRLRRLSKAALDAWKEARK